MSIFPDFVFTVRIVWWLTTNTWLTPIKLHCGGEVMCYVKKVQDIEAQVSALTIDLRHMNHDT